MTIGPIMRTGSFMAGCVAVLSLAACASSTVIPVSANQFIIQTSAAPVCGTSGAAGVAVKMAAVETIRAGFERFVIVGTAASNNVTAITTPVTGTSTNSTFTQFGNTIQGQSNTTVFGGNTVLVGGFDQQLAVQAFRQGDPGFDQAVDARSTLGTDWQTIVKDGVTTCS